jgi:hypothetical protein
LENVEYFHHFGAGSNYVGHAIWADRQSAPSDLAKDGKPSSSMLPKNFYSGIDGASDLGPNATGDGCDVSRPRQPVFAGSAWRK